MSERDETACSSTMIGLLQNISTCPIMWHFSF